VALVFYVTSISVGMQHDRIQQVISGELARCRGLLPQTTV
jgi:hypothetical protein